jgi:hypothetical protein
MPLVFARDRYVHLQNAGALARHRTHQHSEIKAEERHVGSAMVDQLTMGGVDFQVEFEGGDEHRKVKLQAIKNAVELIQSKGKVVPATRFVVTSADGVRNIAFIGDRLGGRSVTIFLGPKILQQTPKTKPANDDLIKGGMGAGGKRGVPDRIYDSRDHWYSSSEAREARATAIIVHEFGHVLHEFNDPDAFWSLKAPPQGGPIPPLAPAAAASLVSEYASGNNYLELVAETFTAMMYGEEFSDAVMDEYRAAGGP